MAMYSPISHVDRSRYLIEEYPASPHSPTMSMKYVMIGAALYPCYIMQNSLWSCGDIEYPDNTELAPYLRYFKVLRTFLSSLRSSWPTWDSSLWRFMSEYDREFNHLWGQYKMDVSSFSSSLTRVVTNAKSGKIFVQINRGRFVVNNANAVLRSAMAESVLTNSFFSPLALSKINSLLTATQSALKPLMDARSDLIQFYSAVGEFSAFKDKLDAYYRIQNDALMQMASAKNMAWLKPVLIAGGLGFAATVAFATFGVGTVTLPFLSGIVITGIGGVYDGFSGYNEAKKKLCCAQRGMEKLINSEDGRRFAIFVVLNSYATVAKMVCDCLESSLIAIDNYVKDNNVKFSNILRILQDIDEFAGSKDKLTESDIRTLSGLSTKLAAGWNYQVIRRYFDYKASDSRRLYCYKYEPPKKLDEASKICADFDDAECKALFPTSVALAPQK